MTLRRFSIALALSLATGSAMAHSGHNGTSFFAGIAHPLGGLDHVLAMLAIGLLAARQGGTLRWALPLSFVGAMFCGAALAAAGITLPLVEAGIAASVLVLGTLVARGALLHGMQWLPLVAAFAAFHGQAHQAEMGGAVLPDYAAGFALVTLALHAAAYLVARALPQSRVALLVQRMLGAAIAGSGLALLAM